jgi:hypothetical protein
VAQVAIQAELASAQELALELALKTHVESVVCLCWAEVHLYLCVSSVSPDILRCHFDKEGIHPFDFEEALPGVLLSQPSPCYALETQHLASFLRGLLREVSSLDTGFHLLSVSNGSGPSHQVWVLVLTEALPNWQSGLSINANRQVRYGSRINSQPV